MSDLTLQRLRALADWAEQWRASVTNEQRTHQSLVIEAANIAIELATLTPEVESALTTLTRERDEARAQLVTTRELYGSGRLMTITALEADLQRERENAVAEKRDADALRAQLFGEREAHQATATVLTDLQATSSAQEAVGLSLMRDLRREREAREQATDAIRSILHDAVVYPQLAICPHQKERLERVLKTLVPAPPRGDASACPDRTDGLPCIPARPSGCCQFCGIAARGDATPKEEKQ